jgi:hypothetical protein
MSDVGYDDVVSGEVHCICMHTYIYMHVRTHVARLSGAAEMQ